MEGRVQGVFFRDWTVEQADALGVTGWVRNRRDGTVELLAEGEEAQITRLIEHLRQGPPAARVEQVMAEETTPTAATTFTRRPTA